VNRRSREFGGGAFAANRCLHTARVPMGLGSGLAIQYPRLDVCHARHRGYRRAIAGHVTVRGREAEAKTPNLDIGGHKSAGRSH